MCLLSSNLSSRPLAFIPNLLKPPGSTSISAIRPACPTRQPLGHPSGIAWIPSPPSSRLPTAAVLSRNATSNCHAVPSIVNLPAAASLQALPVLTVPTAQPDPSFETANVTGNPPSASVASASQRRGHRHTEESRRKIGIANRGNTPWNKGRRHSEETKRKIAENTKRAMLRPEMRQMLQQRAKGRKHTEATKLKIRETARLTRGSAKTANRRQKKCPVPYAFAPDVVRHLNDCITKQIEETFVKDERVGSPKYVVREKRVVSEDTRQKLSRRIKEMWSDPDYRSRVASGVEERYRRLADQKKSDSSECEPEATSATRVNSPTRRRPRSRKDREAIEDHEAKRTRYPDPTDSSHADIVLDPDSLKGWTKEDLGIVGTHGAGRIDEEMMVKPRQQGSGFSRNEEEYYSLGSQEPQRELVEAETVKSTELSYEERVPLPQESAEVSYDERVPLPQESSDVSYEERVPLPQESSDSGFSSPFQAAQDLDISKLDIANEYPLPNSYGNDVDLFEEPGASFTNEQEVDAGIPIGPLDQGDDYFSRSITEAVDHDSGMGNGNHRSVMGHRPSLNYMDAETNTFEGF